MVEAEVGDEAVCRLDSDIPSACHGGSEGDMADGLAYNAAGGSLVEGVAGCARGFVEGIDS